MDCDHYYRIRVGHDSAVYDIADDTNTLTVEDEAGRPSQLELMVSDPYRVLSHALREGMHVEVELGSTSDHGLVFRGFITSVQGDFPEEGTPTMRIAAHDQRARLGLRERTRVFPNQRVADVIERVTESYFSVREVKVIGNPDLDINGIRQSGVTDLCFLLRLARELECQLLLELRGAEDVLRFVPLEELYRQQPALTMCYGRTDVENLLLSFRPAVDLAELRLPVARMAIDAAHGEESEISQEAADPPEVVDEMRDENFSRFQQEFPERAGRLLALQTAARQAEETLSRELGTVRLGEAPPFLKPDQASARGKNRVAQRLLGMRAEGKMVGTPTLRAAQIATVKDVGARFSGNWYMTKVRHVVNGEGYHTEFECER